METARQTALMEQPEIVELFRVLEGNGLTKEQKEVESLVKYLDGMEVQFGQVLEELRDVKEQLSQIQDGGVKASVLRIAEQAQGKVQEVGGQLNTVRKNLIQSAGNALQTYKEKGKDALRKAVSSMKIPSALARIQEGIHGAVENMNRQADRMKVLNGELHAAVLHCRTHALARFLHRRIAEADNVERGKPAGQKAFHRHLVARDALKPQRAHRCDHRFVLLFCTHEGAHFCLFALV